MKRRTFLLGVGSTAVASSAALGTGAFSSVEAHRRLEVEVAGDNDALLGLKQRGDGTDDLNGRSLEGGTPGQVAFSFPGTGELDEDADLGLGADSVYEFDRDSGESDDDEPTEGLLRITNQGTQSVRVYSQFETESNLVVELYDVTDPDKEALRDDPVELAVGSHVNVGFRIRTFNSDIGTFEETLTIVADQPDD